MEPECICHCICLSYLYNDFHAFPKVATLPDTEPTACQARDAKMHKVHNVEKHRQKQWCNQKAKVSRY